MIRRQGNCAPLVTPLGVRKGFRLMFHATCKLKFWNESCVPSHIWIVFYMNFRVKANFKLMEILNFQLRCKNAARLCLFLRKRCFPLIDTSLSFVQTLAAAERSEDSFPILIRKAFRKSRAAWRVRTAQLLAGPSPPPQWWVQGTNWLGPSSSSSISPAVNAWVRRK